MNNKVINCNGIKISNKQYYKMTQYYEMSIKEN